MAAEDKNGAPYVPVAELEVDAVWPGQTGFVLEGQGNDGSYYRLEMHLDMPVDRRTRAVLAELLSQSEWRVSRRVGRSSVGRARRVRPKTPAK
jgi:hypothetical protein